MESLLFIRSPAGGTERAAALLNQVGRKRSGLIWGSGGKHPVSCGVSTYETAVHDQPRIGNLEFKLVITHIPPASQDCIEFFGGYILLDSNATWQFIPQNVKMKKTNRHNDSLLWNSATFDHLWKVTKKLPT